MNEMSDQEQDEIDSYSIVVRMHDTGREYTVTNAQISQVDAMGIETEQLSDVTVVASVAIELGVDAVHADVICTLLAQYRAIVADQ